MHFVVDAQLPPGLVRVLVTRGHTAEHVFDRFYPSVSDAEIWQYALSCGGIIVSKDEDFPQRVLAAEFAPQVLWLRVGNTAVYLVETKAQGQVTTPNVQRKLKAAVAWCDRINGLDGKQRGGLPWHYVLLGDLLNYARARPLADASTQERLGF